MFEFIDKKICGRVSFQLSFLMPLLYSNSFKFYLSNGIFKLKLGISFGLLCPLSLSFCFSLSPASLNFKIGKRYRLSFAQAAINNWDMA